MATFVSDIVRVAFSRIAVIFCGLGVSIITARYLGPENNGIISSLVVYPSLFMTIGSLGIRQSTTYFIGKNSISIESIKTAIVQIWFFTSLFCIIVCAALLFFFSPNNYKSELVLLAIAPIPFSLFVTYNSGIFLGKNEIKEFNKVNWLPNVVILLATYFFLVPLNAGLNGAMLAALLGPIFMFFIMLFKNDFLNSFRIKIEYSVIKSLLSLGIIYAIALMVINLNYRIDIILLERLSSNYETGIYSKGASITQYLWQIPMVLSTIVFARSSNAKDDLLFSNKVAKLLRISIIAISLVSIVLFFLAEYIIVGLYGLDFMGSVRVLQILLPGVVVLTVFKVMNMDLAGKGKPWVSMKAMIPGLICNILLNIWLIPQYGAVGASISSTISYSLAGVLFIIFYSKETRLSIIDIFTFKRSEFKELYYSVLKIIKR
ncbi:flippase [Flavihumibacter sp. UBA7668]|uniref:flippase n=1 Tax=Flavihumibacter sp. UBA7668 TaxID=1946542 RepID=UPI0025BAF3D6|nr:flippase [Flavihumibacter sp. UBA7668]